jgi:hypothetical protein
MKFRILFRDFRCSTAKKLKKIQSIKEKEIMGLEEKKERMNCVKGLYKSKTNDLFWVLVELGFYQILILLLN